MKKSVSHFLMALIVGSQILWSEAEAAIVVDSNFESGSIGEVTYDPGEDVNILALRNDNDNPDLSSRWRNWWSVKVSRVLTDGTVLRITERGHPEYYVPTYSGDQQRWYRMDERLVQQSQDCNYDPDNQTITDCDLTFPISQGFSGKQIYLARFYPYTYTDLENHLRQIAGSQYVEIEELGDSPGGMSSGKDYPPVPIKMVTITDPNINDVHKKRIWIHARTHPGETGSSFAVQGLIDFLLSASADSENIRKQFIFNVVPMVNPDGVRAGNYRTRLNNEDLNDGNLELGWKPNEKDPTLLAADVPLENRIINEKMREFLAPVDGSPPVTMAFNLHSSNEAPETAAYMIPHFGSDPDEYHEEELALWHNQNNFIAYLAHFYSGRIQAPPEEVGRGFLAYDYPETWWWRNKMDQVLAMTLETTYGKAGYEHWVTDSDIFDLGKALAYAIECYYYPQQQCPLPEQAPYNKFIDPAIYTDEHRLAH